jgi:hypothetical protein
MSNKLSKGFCAKLTALAMLATSLSLSALPWARAQSMGDTTDAAGSAAAKSGATTASTSASTSGNSSGINASSATSATASSTTPSTTTSTSTAPATTAAPASEIPPGVLWTDPKYAVKEMPPARVAVPTKNRPTTGTSHTQTPPAATPVDLGYDDKAAEAFAGAVTVPQLVWTRQDPVTKGQKAVNTSKEMHAYNRGLVEKFVSNMVVPNNATLVENSTAQYLYLISFTIDAKGKIIHINSEKSYGQYNALNLADDNENAAMTASITKALAKCSPVKVPPAGISPWYMLLRYEPNTGKVFVAHLNTI